ncbi:MAG: hypothetical protein IH593_08640, partial [Bacteroidales bacterium]|nr:hypothetical protein [Bacteroidales bacterium]
MKKTISILFVCTVLLTGFQAVISTHYCGGRFADARVSLSGQLASCGMEGNEEGCPLPGSH